jgi:hypothetical protein
MKEVFMSLTNESEYSNWKVEDVLSIDSSKEELREVEEEEWEILSPDCSRRHWFKQHFSQDIGGFHGEFRNINREWTVSP